MFGIGFFELVVIAVVALIFVGPQKLPEVMKQAGRFFVQIRRTANEVKSTFDGVIRQAEDEIRREEADAMRLLLAKNATPTTATPILPAGEQDLHSQAVLSDDATRQEAQSAHVPDGVRAHTPPHVPHSIEPTWDSTLAVEAPAATEKTTGTAVIKDKQ